MQKYDSVKLGNSHNERLSSLRYPILQRTTKTNELQYSSCILNMPKRCFKHQFKGLTCNIIVEKLRCHRELNVHVYTEYSIYIFTV